MLREFSGHVALPELLTLTQLPVCLVWSQTEQQFSCVENSPEKHIRFVAQGQMAHTLPMVLQQQLKLIALAEDKKYYDKFSLSMDEENSSFTEECP